MGEMVLKILALGNVFIGTYDAQGPGGPVTADTLAPAQYPEPIPVSGKHPVLKLELFTTTLNAALDHFQSVIQVGWMDQILPEIQ
jgi:hypothetical protein